MEVRDLIDELKRHDPHAKVLVRVTIGHAVSFTGVADPEQNFTADRVEPVPGEGVQIQITE